MVPAAPRKNRRATTIGRTPAVGRRRVTTPSRSSKGHLPVSPCRVTRQPDLPALVLQASSRTSVLHPPRPPVGTGRGRRPLNAQRKDPRDVGASGRFGR